jgi:glycerol 2-dehydrogenase (NADP+)
VARGSAVLAKSVHPSRIEENMKIVELSKDDMEALNGISKKGVKRFVYPDFGVNFGFPDKQ